MTYNLLAKLRSVIQKHRSQSIIYETVISERYRELPKIRSFYKAGMYKDENWTMPKAAMTNQAKKKWTHNHVH